jgi:hypothetical protein
VTEPTPAPRPRSDDSTQADPTQADPTQAELARLDTLATADHLDVYNQIADELAARLAAPDADPSQETAGEPDRPSNG